MASRRFAHQDSIHGQRLGQAAFKPDERHTANEGAQQKVSCSFAPSKFVPDSEDSSFRRDSPPENRACSK